MGYVKTAGARRQVKKKRGFLSRVLGAFGDSGPGGATCEAYDATGKCVFVDASDSGINNPDDVNMSEPVSTSSTSQDTTVLPSGAVVGGQGTGIPTASPGTGPWVILGGIGIATTTDFLATLKELQRQANRCASAVNPPIALIGVDGKIGQGTLGLLSALAKKGALAGLANPTLTAYNVCQYADAFTAALSAWADANGASGSVSSPSGATPQVYNTTTGKLESQGAVASVADMWNNLSSVEQGVAVGAVAVLGYTMYADKKKRRK